jgi:hypothetical protein
MPEKVNLWDLYRPPLDEDGTPHKWAKRIAVGAAFVIAAGLSVGGAASFVAREDRNFPCCRSVCGDDFSLYVCTRARAYASSPAERECASLHMGVCKLFGF